MAIWVREGDVCRTAVPRGISGQTRNHCPACHRFLPVTQDPVCSACGAQLREVTDGVHKVVRLGPH